MACSICTKKGNAILGSEARISVLSAALSLPAKLESAMALVPISTPRLVTVIMMQSSRCAGPLAGLRPHRLSESAAALSNAELVRDEMAVDLPGTEYAGWEFRPIGRVWETLRLEAESSIIGMRAVIELNAGLGRGETHRKIGVARRELRHGPGLRASLPRDDEGVVIVDAGFARAPGFAEVVGRPGY